MSFKFVFDIEKFKGGVIDRRVIRDKGKRKTLYPWFLNIFREVGRRAFGFNLVCFG